MPGETETSFKKTLNFAKNLPLSLDEDLIEFFVATPFPGSDLDLKSEEYGVKIINKNYNMFNCREIIMETKSLDYSKISSMIEEAANMKKKMIK